MSSHAKQIKQDVNVGEGESWCLANLVSAFLK